MIDIRLLRTAKKSDIRGTALLRLDFNTEGAWRMESALPTLRYLLARRCKVVVVSHKGRPKGFDARESLRAKARVLGSRLGRKALFIPHLDFPVIRKHIESAPPGSLFVLENLRFVHGEYINSASFAKRLASLGDLYINDAFAVDHRANASLVAITEFLPSYAGFGLEREIKHLSHVIARPKRPLVLIMGGAKTETKLPVMRYFKSKADAIIAGGVLANTLLQMAGHSIGSSAYDPDPPPGTRNILRFKNLELPLDCRISRGAMLDIGPRSAKRFEEIISRARTIVWNGPFGFTEKKAYQAGTLAIARAVAKNRKAFSVVGGGETIALLRRHGLDKKFTFVSTGGGAMLEFLAGKPLPGIEALRK